MVINDLTNKELLENLDENTRLVVYHKTQMTYHKSMITDLNSQLTKVRKELSKRL